MTLGLARYGGRGEDRSDDQGDEPRRDRQTMIFTETVNLFSDSAGVGRVDVIFRIPTSFFVFVADDNDLTGNRYTAGAEMGI